MTHSFIEQAKKLSAAATKGPYRIEIDEDELVFINGVRKNKIDEKYIAVICECIKNYDAQYIVHCVNSHMELVEMLEMALNKIEEIYADPELFNSQIHRKLQKEITARLDKLMGEE